jgi:hypothetical protein
MNVDPAADSQQDQRSMLGNDETKGIELTNRKWPDVVKDGQQNELARTSQRS